MCNRKTYGFAFAAFGGKNRPLFHRKNSGQRGNKIEGIKEKGPFFTFLVDIAARLLPRAKKLHPIRMEGLVGMYGRKSTAWLIGWQANPEALPGRLHLQAGKPADLP